MIYKYDFYYSPTNSYRKIHLYIPNNYNDTNESYPVIYFFDGNNLFFDGDSLFGMSMQLEWYLENYDKKVIVVGIEQPRGEYERVKEHCPYNIDSDMFGHIDGRGDATIRWIINELKPHIDSNYRTIPFRECTAIAGCSSAGVTAIYGITKYNRYFSKAISISPAIMNTKYVLSYDILNEDISPDTKVFISYGTNEYGDNYGLRSFCINNMYEIENLLMKRNVKTYMYKNEGGDHNEIFWRNEIFSWLDFIWKS